jgi:hypothetical protein
MNGIACVLDSPMPPLLARWPCWTRETRETRGTATSMRIAGCIAKYIERVVPTVDSVSVEHPSDAGRGGGGVAWVRGRLRHASAAYPLNFRNN